MVLKHPRWGLLPALVELLDLHGRAIHALPVSIYFETQFFPKICGARLLISDLFGCALFCVQQNLWSFPQICGAQRFKSVRGFRVIAPRKKEEGWGGTEDKRYKRYKIYKDIKERYKRYLRYKRYKRYKKDISDIKDIKGWAGKGIQRRSPGGRRIFFVMSALE